MGTRAAFFIGDPRDVEKREWLGCVAYDAFPNEDYIAPIAKASTPEAYRALVLAAIAGRDDYADPAKGGFPFPWVDDLFLTDYVYAFFDGKPMCTLHDDGGKRLVPHALAIEVDETRRQDGDVAAPVLAQIAAAPIVPRNTPAPGDGTWDMGQPDSIMILGGPR